MLFEQEANLYQRRFWLEWCLDRTSLAYNTPLIYKLDGVFSFGNLHRSLEYFVNYHDVGCRSTFEETDGKLLQIIHPYINVTINEISCHDNEILDKIKNFLGYHFDLIHGPLFKFGLITTSGGVAYLLLNFHHIISDAKSAHYFVEALLNLYKHFSLHEPLYLSSRPWEKETDLNRQGCVASEPAMIEYWQRQIESFPLSVALPRQYDAKLTFSLAAPPIGLSASLVDKIKNFCKQYGCTPFILFTAIYFILLRVYSGQERILINYPADCRKKQHKKLTGCFTNNYIMAYEVTQTICLVDIINSIKNQRYVAKSNMDCALSCVLEKLRLRSDIDSHVFNVGIAEVFFNDKEIELTSLKLQPVSYSPMEMAEDLLLMFQIDNQEVRFRFNYRQDYFSSDFIECLSTRFISLLSTSLDFPHSEIDKLINSSYSGLSFIASNAGFNQLVNSISTDTSFCQTIFNNFRMFPEKLALQCGQVNLTYSEVFQRVQLISKLVNKTLNEEGKKSSVIGILLERSVDLPLAVLSVLFSGCAYLPLDPKLPVKRLSFMLEENQTFCIVTTRELLVNLGRPSILSNRHIICLDEVELTGSPTKHSLVIPKHSDLAYVIYTSGSTGLPKGVLIEHAAITNVLVDFAKQLNLPKRPNILGTTALTFDIFALEMFLPLYLGGSLRLLTNVELSEISELASLFSQYQPDLIQGTPSFWHMLKIAGWVGWDGLTVLCGGEALTYSLTEYLLSIAKNVYQVYGPSETTIWSTRKKVTQATQYNQIGEPIANTWIWILDDKQKVLPYFALGEVCIGGAGLARGYNGNSELTNERFVKVELPFSDKNVLTRVYRTGDRAYCTPDGTVVFIGRMDLQIKIRGHRVELAEIEFYLNQFNDIQQAVVVTYTIEAELRLVAFINSTRPHVEFKHELSLFLSRYLPSYMIPTYYVEVKQFPLSSSGKIDRSQLKIQSLESTSITNDMKTPTEICLQNIWSDSLDINNVSIDDNFFALGGHSIKAAKVIMSISKIFSVNISFDKFTLYPTIRQQALYIDEHRVACENLIPKRIEADAIEFQLSNQQHHILMSQLSKNTGPQSYNVIAAQKLLGNLDILRLEFAINQTVKKHAILRAKICSEQGRYYQKIYRYRPQKLIVKNINSHNLDSEIRRCAEKKIKLNENILYQFKLLKINQADHVLILVIHHLLVDGWSMNIINHELSAFYNGYVATDSASDMSYYQYVDRQQKWFKSSEYHRVVKFWQLYLKQYTKINLIKDYHINNDASRDCERQFFVLSQEMTTTIKLLAQREQTTVFNVILSAVLILLYRHLQQNELTVWCSVANRFHTNTEHTVGLFSTILPLCHSIQAGSTINEVIRAVTINVTELLTHQGISFEDVRSIIGDAPSNRDNEDKLIFSYQNANDNYQLNLNDISVENIVLETSHARYALFLNVHEQKQELYFCFEYFSQIYSRSFISRFCEQLQTILNAVVNVDCHVRDINLITDKVCRQLYGKEKVLFYPKKTILDGFTLQTLKLADHIAISQGDEHVSYAELDKASTVFAHNLLAKYKDIYNESLPANTLVGLSVERKIDTIVGMLGIMKAGAAYVPFDPQLPDDRLAVMLSDSQIKIFVAVDDESNPIIPKGIIIHLCYKKLLQQEVYINLPNISPNNLAYVIYTSGSTGKPKGVLITHHNIFRLFQSTDTIFDFDNKDVWCLFHSCAFDFSVWEIWGALTSGGRVVIPSFCITRDPITFVKFLKDTGITVLNQTPTAFKRLLDVGTEWYCENSLRYIIFGGEQLDESILDIWWQQSKASIQLVNMYGITEICVHATHHFLRPNLGKRNAHKCIGLPLADLKIYIADANHCLTPHYVIGEMYVAGDGLASGYLNNIEFTKKSFISGKLLGLNEDVLYKTGDKAYWLDDGTLAYFGRADQQVKINGYRIELDEICHAIKLNPSIRDAVVLYHIQKKLLVACYTIKKKIDFDNFRQQLERKLPHYMLPSRYIEVDHFKMTQNGKIDHEYLLSLPITSNSDKSVILPRTEQEAILLKIYRSVLGVDQVSIDDNFFMLGGDSIKMMQVIALAAQSDLTITPQQMFRHPSVIDLTKIITNVRSIEYKAIPIEPFNLFNAKPAKKLRKYYADAYPLAKLQQGMLFHSEFSNQSTHYIDVVSCIVTGKYDENILMNLLTELAKMHPVLRTVFIFNENNFIQCIKHDLEIDYQYVDLKHETEEIQKKAIKEICLKERHNSFSISDGPLWRIIVFGLSKERFCITLICHHAILDGWSVAVFFSQLLKSYDSKISSKALNNVSYAPDYKIFIAEELLILKSSEAAKFWINELASVTPCCFDDESYLQANDHKLIAKLNLLIPNETSNKLKEVAQEFEVGLDTLFLACHMLTLSILFDARTVVSGLATNSRPSVVGSERTLGLFLNVIPFIFQSRKYGSWMELIKQIHQKKGELQPYKQLPLVEIQRVVNKNQLFDHMFNFINFHVFNSLQDLQSISVNNGFCYEETNYHLITQISIEPRSGILQGCFLYQKNHISKSVISTFSNLFSEILYNLADDHHKNINLRQFRRYLNDYYPRDNWNQKSDAIAATDKSLYALFSAVADKSPDKIAVIDGEERLTYDMLRKKALKFARFLETKLDGMKKLDRMEYRVGIYMDRSIKTIISMLAIVEIGAAYVPISKDYPQLHVELIIDEAKLDLIVIENIIDDTYQWLLNKYSKMTLDYDTCMRAAKPIRNLAKNKNIVLSTLACIMMTSGSTGKPKAVLIEQKSIVRLVKNTNYIDINNDDIVAHAANISFDASIFEIWAALLNGATVAIIPKMTLLLEKEFFKLLLQLKISILWLTARLFDRYVDFGLVEMFANLRYLLIGGEVLSKRHVSLLLQNKLKKPRNILNGYGPTENTTFTTIHRINNHSLLLPTIPIGKPITGTTVYILDNQMKLVPVGQVGELYISGLGLARGYSDVNLTKTKFKKHRIYLPSSRQYVDELLYQTGDFVRWLDTGEIEYFGRIDRLIKVRGFRIDLNEIEDVVRSCKGINNCCVVKSDDRLVLYYTTYSPRIAQEAIKEFLLRHLPDYMHPAVYIRLDHFSLNDNGKIDLSKLPSINKPAHQMTRLDGRITDKLSQIWQQILMHKDFNKESNFFDVGGNSLLAMQLCQLVVERFGSTVTVIDIFRYPTIDAFAKFLNSNQDDELSVSKTTRNDNKLQRIRLRRRNIKSLLENEEIQ